MSNQGPRALSTHTGGGCEPTVPRPCPRRPSLPRPAWQQRIPLGLEHADDPLPVHVPPPRRCPSEPPGWRAEAQSCTVARSRGCQRAFLLSAAIDWSGSSLYSAHNSSLTDR